MNFLSTVKKFEYLIIVAIIFLFATSFGTVEILRGAPLDNYVSMATILLALLVSYHWVRTGREQWLLYVYLVLQPMTLFPVDIFGIRLSFIMLPLAFVAGLYLFLTHKITLRIPRAFFPLLLFLGVIALSTLINIQGAVSFERLLLFVSNLLFVFVVVNLIRTRNELQKLLSAWFVSITLLIIFGFGVSLYARFSGDTTLPFIQGSIDGIIRISSITPDSNYFAALLLVPLAIALSSVFARTAQYTKKTQIFLWIFSILATTTILITYSRAGLVALVLVFFLYAFFESQWKTYLFWARLIFILVISVSTATLIQPDFLRNMVLRAPDVVIAEEKKIELARALDLDKSNFPFIGNGSGLSGIARVKPGLDSSFERNIADEAIDVRGLYWGVAYKMIADKPILGLGAGGYPQNFEKYLGYSYWTKLPNTHNIYLEAFAEFGVVGLIALMYFLMKMGNQLRVLHRFGDQKTKRLLFALGTAFIASLAQFFFQPGFNILNIWLICAIIGVLEFEVPKKS